jgi:hypothetical protein
LFFIAHCVVVLEKRDQPAFIICLATSR